MMRNFFTRLLAAFTLLCFTSAHAVTGAPSFITCTKPAVRLVFSNGIGTSLEYATTQAVKLAKHAKSHPDAAVIDTEYVLTLYHQDNGFLGDLSEVFLQKMAEAQYSDLTFQEKSEAFFGILIGIKLVNPIGELLFQMFANLVIPAMAQSATERVAETTELDLSRLQGMLDAGDSVLIVAHSQGNLYSNVTVRQLYQTRSPTLVDSRIGYVGAGVPNHSLVAQGGADSVSPNNYVTNTLDVVIQLLGTSGSVASFPPPLPGNVYAQEPEGTVVDKDAEGVFVLGHSFLRIYFGDAVDAGKLVKAKIDARLSELARNVDQQINPSALAYTVRARLTFDRDLTGLFPTGAMALPTDLNPYPTSYTATATMKSPNTIDVEYRANCSIWNYMRGGEYQNKEYQHNLPARLRALDDTAFIRVPTVSNVTVTPADGAVTWKYSPDLMSVQVFNDSYSSLSREFRPFVQSGLLEKAGTASDPKLIVRSPISLYTGTPGLVSITKN